MSQTRALMITLASLMVVVPGNAGTPREADGVPRGLRAGDWAEIRRIYETRRHAVVAMGDGCGAYNPGQQWSLCFDGRGLMVTPTLGDWTWGLGLVRYGFESAERDVTAPACPRADDQRVTYDWDATLTEWYVNDRSGVEHGYTVHRRPARASGDSESLLTFVLDVRGDLTPRVDADGRGARFVDATGGVAVHYGGLTVFDADGRTLTAFIELAPEGLRLLVDERDARYPLTIDPIAQQAYLKASNTDALDAFGGRVAVFGNTVVVAAHGEASTATGVNGDQGNNLLAESGAVYVFVRNGTTWTQQAYLKASSFDPSPPTGFGDKFGSSVAISHDTIVVGAREEDSDATGVDGDQDNDLATWSGAAYVFVRNGSTWTQQAYLKASNTGVGDQFGVSVAVSRDTIVVGAWLEDSAAVGVNGIENDDSVLNAGAAYVFVRNGTTWSQQAYLKASNTEIGDFFGTQVAASEDTIVVSSGSEDSAATGVNGDQSDNSAPDAGAAYVFVRNGTTWSQEAYLKPSNTDPGDTFVVTAIDGDTIVVGAPREDSAGTGVDGNQEDNSAPTSGAAYVFVRNGTTWTQQAYLKASNTDAGDFFAGGTGVSISGDTLIVGASSEASGATGVNGNQADNSAPAAGAAYVFSRSGTTWSQEAYLKASNAESNDGYAGAVCVHGDTLIVGSIGEDSNATGVNDNQGDNSLGFAGAAYVYFTPAPLTADVPSLSLAAGGQQQLALDAGFLHAGWAYWVLGSVTGTSPGIAFGGGVNLPLKVDSYFLLTLTKPFGSIFGSYVGLLDGTGLGAATLTIPPGAKPDLVGITLYHAYLAGPMLGGVEYASNPVALLLTP